MTLLWTVNVPFLFGFVLVLKPENIKIDILEIFPVPRMWYIFCCQGTSGAKSKISNTSDCTDFKLGRCSRSSGVSEVVCHALILK